MTYDQWKTTDPCEGLQDERTCERCNARETVRENEYGEFICAECEDNAAEAAYERHCEAFHDGGNTSFKSLQQQQIEARRFK